jgi:hypothetical protein
VNFWGWLIRDRRGRRSLYVPLAPTVLLAISYGVFQWPALNNVQALVIFSLVDLGFQYYDWRKAKKAAEVNNHRPADNE